MSGFSAKEKEGKEKIIERAITSIKSYMKAGRLEIDRKYLPEIVSPDLLDLGNDGLPTLKPFVTREFNARGIIVKKFQNRAIFYQGREGIRGVIICDSTGLPIDSTMDINISEEVAAYVTLLIGKGKQVIEALNEGSLKSIRLETSKGETMIALESNLILIILK
ncbi:MAG: roadblock/LC7 domain-containing protein [Promethearchaeota archaeon]